MWLIVSISVQTETIYEDSVSLKRRQFNELKEGKMKKKEGERLEQEQVNHPYYHYRYYYFFNQTSVLHSTFHKISIHNS